MSSESFSEVKEKEKPKRVYIELGAGRRSAPAEGMALSENDFYFGIDIDEKALTTISNTPQDKQHSTKKQNIYFIRGDATRLPLGNEISDEVFMKNVLGDPEIEEKMKEGFLDEAWRIAKVGSRLIITETYTPRKLKDVRELLKRHGFVIEQIEKIARKPSPFSAWDESFSYHVFAQKVS